MVHHHHQKEKKTNTFNALIKFTSTKQESKKVHQQKQTKNLKTPLKIVYE